MADKTRKTPRRHDAAANRAAQSAERYEKAGRHDPVEPHESAAAAMAVGRVRAVIDAVFPVVDGGRFPAKRIAGEAVRVEAHCFADGHDRLRVVLSWQQIGRPHLDEVEMAHAANDVWSAEFTPPVPGRYRFTVTAWVDHFESWRRELERRDDLSDIRSALLAGASLLAEAAAQDPRPPRLPRAQATAPGAPRRGTACASIPAGRSCSRCR